MKELQTVLNNILTDKNTNLKPENLKKGVTCLGVTGTYEGSGGGSIVEGVKQFSTVEEMNSSTGNTEGDLAVVYRNEIQNATVDSKFQTATFPETVVLDTAITDYVEVRYRAVDSSKMFDCTGSLDSSGFTMDCYTESSNIRIEYTSEDGITYTRTDATGNPVDFGTEIYYEMTEMWNDAIGKFIQIGGSTFEGLYEYRDSSWVLAPTQLSAIADDVLNKEFYGINGVEKGTLQNTEVQSKTELNIKVTLWDSYSKNLEYNGSLENAFEGNTEIETIPNIDISLVESMWGTFAGCTNLKSIPELNTINVKHFTRTFIGCTNLVTIPILPTNNATTMSDFVSGCPNLSDETLNNILQMCINATNYTQTKSLSHLGLTVEQRSKCMTLSNYTAFTNAGWTA